MRVGVGTAGDGIRRNEDKSVDDRKLTGEIPTFGLQTPSSNHYHNNIGYSMGLKKNKKQKYNCHLTDSFSLTLKW